jgi:PPOX class probable F420-dependent enzyme
MIDWNEAFAKKANRRLARERVGWLVTVGADLAPQPRPVWFLWDGGTVLLYSQARARKVAHIALHPKVAFHLNTDEEGGKVAVLLGEALADPAAPPADKLPAYLRKYRQGIRGLEMTPEEFAKEYSVAIRIRPDSLRGW